MVESNNSEHQESAKLLISKCLPLSGKSSRIAISGSPGVGKSTIIEALGLHVISQGRKPAILAIDPTSDISQGSILGDKTRMEQLSKNESAFIRPSPTSGTLGGVAKNTIESIILCESAGYDTILIETVGVGQSETFAQKLTDLFILLVAPGGGDELQGIKKGIVELADIIVVNKAEDDRKALSDATISAYENALHLAAPKASGWTVKVTPCSALHNQGIDHLWNLVLSHIEIMQKNNRLEEKRKNQRSFWAKNSMESEFASLLITNHKINRLYKAILDQVRSGEVSPDKAAQELLSNIMIEVKHD